MTFDPRKERGRKTCQGHVDHSSTSSEHLNHHIILHRRSPVPSLSLAHHRHQEYMRHEGSMQIPSVCAHVTFGKVGVKKHGGPPTSLASPSLPLPTQGKDIHWSALHWTVIHQDSMLSSWYLISFILVDIGLYFS